MTSSADLPEGFLAEVFRNGCQCDHCVKWRAEVARLREAIRREAERHERRAFYVGMVQVSCPCDLCLTDREGR